MTKEEAIDILVGVIAANSEEENEALDMGVNALRIMDKLIPYLEGMAEDMRAMGDCENASGIESALWLIERMERGER